MHSLDFSEITITLDEWEQLDDAGKRDRSAPGILVVTSDSRIESLGSEIDRFKRIVVTSIDFNDGRIFSIGRQSRLLGFAGRLSVVGDILPDQFIALKYCGFDDVLSLDSDAINGVIDLDHTFSLATVGSQLNGSSDDVFTAGNHQ